MRSRFEVDEAVGRFNWEALLISRVDGDVTESNDNWLSICPFCHHDRMSFAVSLRGLYICYHCGVRGNGITLVMKLLHVTRTQAEERICGGGVFYDPPPAPKTIKLVDVALPSEFERLTTPVETGNARFWKYAARRGLDYGLVTAYHIGFCRTGPYDGRLVVPVTWQGELVSFIARDITGQAKVKVLTPAGGRQSQYLFNLDAVTQWNSVVVVEGVFDCLALGAGVVASFGKRLTDAQVGLLVKYHFKSVTICWDADARLEGLEAADRLSPFMDVRVALLDKGDPNDQPVDRVLEAIAVSEGSTFMARMREGYKTAGGQK
jgi:DNA primase